MRSMALVSMFALALMVGCSDPEADGDGGGNASIGEACGSDGDCQDGLSCEDGTCGLGCAEDFDCPLGFTCIDQTCTGNNPNNGNNGDACDPACGDDQECVDGACVDVETDCDPACGDDQECVDGACVDVEVECDPACGDDQECVDGACVDIEPPACDPPCSDDQECVDGACVDIEPPACDPPCNDDQECVDGACVDIEPLACDPPCNDDQECVDGACVDIEPICDPACEDGLECVEGECVALYPTCENAGDLCDDNTDLGQTWTCLVADNTAPDSPRTCRALCQDTPDCGEGEWCGLTEGTEVPVCLPANCDGILSDACADIASNCERVGDDLFHCIAAGPGQPGAPCAGLGACDLGLLCLGGSCQLACNSAAEESVCAESDLCVPLDGYGDDAGACQRGPHCVNPGGLCEGPDWDDRRLKCLAGNPLRGEELVCLQDCSLNAGCPADHTCQRFVRGQEFLEVCVAANCTSPLRPDECAAIGENGGNCIPRPEGVNRCRPAGDLGDGESCQELGDCAPGLGCNEGICAPLCTMYGDTCGEGEYCNPLPDVPGTGTCAFNICEPGCLDGEICYEGACVTADTCTEEGQPCDDDTLDGPGFTCVAGGDSRNPAEMTCHRLCDPGNGDGNCFSGSFCTPFQQLGICLRSNCNGPFDLESCNEDQGCYIARNETPYCFTAGDLGEGEACEAIEECQGNLFCFRGTCQRHCTLQNDDEACGEGTTCLSVLAGEAVGLCGDGCPSFDTTDECGENRSCFPLDDDSGFCVDNGDGELGDACVANEDCPAFSGCYTATGIEEPACTALCDRRDGLGDEHCEEGDVCFQGFNGNEVTGICFDGCTPFTDEAENGCETEGQLGCVAVDNQARGLCIESGNVDVGARCLIQDGSVFGDCVGHAACDTGGGQGVGTCRNVCRTFSSAYEYESGCEEDEVCGLFGLEWGVCTTNFQAERPAPFEECDPERALWCDDDVICANFGQGVGQCIPICRSETGDPDCPGETTCQLGFFVNDRLGLCMQ